MATWWSKINFDVPDFEFLPSTSLIVCLCWSIWNSRNNWSFRELKDDPIRIYEKLLKAFLNLWRQPLQPGNLPQEPRQEKCTSLPLHQMWLRFTATLLLS
ncbi:hypothetical protein Gorai_009795, partial [Gossypium raimondii]|nr:hypothetical protein [Gossypium raimondii]